MCEWLGCARAYEVARRNGTAAPTPTAAAAKPPSGALPPLPLLLLRRKTFLLALCEPMRELRVSCA